MRWRTLSFVLGWLMMAFGGFLTLPAWVSWYFNDKDAGMFALMSIVYMFFGVLLVLMNRSAHFHLTHRDGMLITVTAWVGLSLLGAFPLYFSHVSPSLVDAFFEAVSGMTTTGATVLSGLDDMSHGILFWRALLQWLGGMGIVVLAVAVLPFLGIGGLQLYRSEMPGVTKDKLQPRLRETARLLWIVYFVVTTACAVGYWWAGMSLFDAVTHAFTTLSTGGFANYDASFIVFDNEKIRWVCIFFMLVGAGNFAAHFMFLSGRGVRGYVHSFELHFLLVVIASASVVIAATNVSAGKVASWTQALKDALFNVVSVVSSTGFSTVDFSLWPYGSMLMLMILMFIGGCTGSTAGGMKVLRIILIIKQGLREIQRLLHPSGVINVKIDGNIVPDRVIQSVWAFAGLYITSFALVSLVMALYGLDLVSAFSAAAATLCNVGPGLGAVGPLAGYGHLPDGAKLTLCFAMLLGRLEMFTLLVLLMPSFWRK